MEKSSSVSAVVLPKSFTLHSEHESQYIQYMSNKPDKKSSKGAANSSKKHPQGCVKEENNVVLCSKIYMHELQDDMDILAVLLT